MEILKNNDYTVDIIDLGMDGEGIAKIDGYTVFIPNVLIGENVDIKLIKAGKDFGFGKLLKINKQSEDRVAPFCDVFEKCGGCNLQHLSYEKQLEYKMKLVKNNFRKFGIDENIIKEIVGMENPIEYRNKAQYPCGTNKEGKAVSGFYGKRSHNIIENNGCKIEHHISEILIKEIMELVNKNKISIYNENTNKGFLRHVVIKIGFSTNEIMIIFVTNGKDKLLNEVVVELLNKHDDITTIVQNVNTSNSNVILGERNIIIHGEGYIHDNLGEHTFNISPMSFYQVNPIQTEKLYSKAKEYANLNKDEILFDLYCGIGTIGSYCSDKAKKVYGIEVVSQAIHDAKENAKNNKINNIEFLCGEAEHTIDELYNKKIYADCVIVDPPRKGLDKKLIDTLLEKQPEKIVYVSCSSSTLARDLKLFSDKYIILECTLFDMFPHTAHVESVVKLARK